MLGSVQGRQVAQHRLFHGGAAHRETCCPEGEMHPGRDRAHASGNSFDSSFGVVFAGQGHYTEWRKQRIGKATHRRAPTAWQP